MTGDWEVYMGRHLASIFIDPNPQSYYDALLRLVNQYNGHGYVERGTASCFHWGLGSMKIDAKKPAHVDLQDPRHTMMLYFGL